MIIIALNFYEGFLQAMPFKSLHFCQYHNFLRGQKLRTNHWIFYRFQHSNRLKSFQFLQLPMSHFCSYRKRRKLYLLLPIDSCPLVSNYIQKIQLKTNQQMKLIFKGSNFFTTQRLFYFLCVNYTFLIIQLMSTKDSLRSSTKRDQLINDQRKKLQQLRLQTQSQNTKLLKIQQKQRQVQNQYQNKKKDMEQTLAQLALEAQNFMRKQSETTQEFQSQKQQIFANDRKKIQYIKQKQQLSDINQKRRRIIKQKQQTLAQKKQQLQKIRQQIQKHLIYQHFLKQVKGLSQDFNTGQFDQYSVMSILQRYQTMKKKKEQLSELSKKLQLQKEKKVKRIQLLKKQKQQDIMKFNSRVKQLKGKIDKYSQQIVQLSSQLQGKLNQNGQKQRQLGQIIFSIRGLYLSIVGEQKGPKTIVEMLDIVKQQRKKLKEYLQLFQKKAEQKNKT